MVFSFLLRIQKKHLQKHGNFRCELGVSGDCNKRSNHTVWDITRFVAAVLVLFYKHRRKFTKFARSIPRMMRCSCGNQAKYRRLTPTAQPSQTQSVNHLRTQWHSPRLLSPSQHKHLRSFANTIAWSDAIESHTINHRSLQWHHLRLRLQSQFLWLLGGEIVRLCTDQWCQDIPTANATMDTYALPIRNCHWLWGYIMNFIAPSGTAVRGRK